jgi:CHAD domain-containing protein
MASTDGLEIERKFDVAEATPLAALHELPAVRRVEQPVEHALEAVYFDTRELTLAARHITVRRRTGGDDAGWHLKLPVSPEQRSELHEPLGGDPNRVPERLLRLVRVHLRGKALVPVARLHTRRVVRRLHGENDDVIAVFCDDRVRAERLAPESVTESWREWEVELVDGGAAFLDAAESLFAAAGVHRSASASKLARALGDRVPPQKQPAPWTYRHGTAANTLLTYVDEHVRALVEQDPLVRQGAPDSVHDMRIAARRLRSALATYRALLAAEVAGRLRDELKWLGGALGASRDIEVINLRLDCLVGSEPPGLVLGPVASRIDAQLGAEATAALHTGLGALDSERYFRLLNDLDWLLASPPLTDRATRSAEKTIPRLVDGEWRRLREAARAASKRTAAELRDPALHEVRKAAKRLRYAAEVAVPVRRKTALRLVDAAQELQTILGEHQDSVVARDALLRVSTQAYLHGENGFSYGRLHALEERNARESDARFQLAWKHFPKGLLRG